MPRSEKEKMLQGELYDPSSPELVESRLRARMLFTDYNASSPGDLDRRREILCRLLGSMGEGVSIESPFFCDYGFNLSLGDRVHINFNCTILDPAKVSIGDRTLIGPGVQIYTPSHPLDPDQRATMMETAHPVAIGRNVWIGGGAIICPGVSIGDGSVIGAGSVVTRDIPEQVVAVGNPCRVIRSLQGDRS